MSNVIELEAMLIAARNELFALRLENGRLRRDLKRAKLIADAERIHSKGEYGRRLGDRRAVDLPVVLADANI